MELIGHAECPPPQRAHFESLQREARGPLEEELAERPIYRLMVVRWNQHVETTQRSFAPDDFIAWMLRLYDAMLHSGNKPGGRARRKSSSSRRRFLEAQLERGGFAPGGTPLPVGSP